mgnify:CR=1 FL=1
MQSGNNKQFTGKWKPMSENKKATAKIKKPNEAVQKASKKPKEIGGPKGPEPTRYGDWEKNGRCSDF